MIWLKLNVDVFQLTSAAAITPNLRSSMKSWNSQKLLESHVKLNPKASLLSQNCSLHSATAHMWVQQDVLSAPLENEPKHQDHIHFTTQLLLLFMSYKATVVKNDCKILPIPPITTAQNVETLSQGNSSPCCPPGLPPLLPLYENSYLMFILLPAEIFNFPAWTKQHEHL